MKPSEIETLEQFVEHARSLRAASQEAEARFLLFLREFEIGREDLWKVGGAVTFDSFLQSNQIVNAARYRNFCAGASLLGDGSLRAGAAATIEAGRFSQPTKEGIRQFQTNVDAYRDVHGSAPSGQTAHEWVKQLDEKPPKVIGQASRLRTLEAENQALRADKRDLERKLAAAQKEIGKLERLLGKSKSKAA